MMTISEDSDIGGGDLGRMDVRLDVLFEQKQVAVDKERTNNGIMTAEGAEENPFIARLYEKTDDLHERYRTMVEEVSRLKEKIKQIESMHITEEKHDSKFLMTNNGTTTEEEAEGEYDAKAFLAALFKEMDDWYWICGAIIDEMDRGKEMREKISEELYSFQDGAILLMMDAKPS